VLAVVTTKEQQGRMTLLVFWLSLLIMHH